LAVAAILLVVAVITVLTVNRNSRLAGGGSQDHRSTEVAVIMCTGAA
jgi:hypothetical protein